MQHLNYWKQFENTGKIEDYLSYRACTAQDTETGEKDAAAGGQQSGVNPYAGYSMCNRNCVETDAYR